MSPGTRAALNDGDQLVLAGLVSLRVQLHRPEDELSSTGGETERHETARLAELPRELRTLAWALTEPWRCEPASPVPPRPVDLETALHVPTGRSTTSASGWPRIPPWPERSGEAAPWHGTSSAWR